MKKLILCSVAVLCVAASIFGGYYYYVGNDLQETEVQQYPSREDNESYEATDKEIPYAFISSARLESDGSINSNGVANAIEQREFYLNEHKPPEGFGNNGIAKGQLFSPIGPTNLGGRTEAILVHPENPTTIWAGGASGGVWISYNGGHRWRAVNGELGNYNVSCLAFDPGDETYMTIYAGTGAHDLHGDGIFRSVDGGLNWKRLDHGHENGWKYVSSISVARINNNTVILAAVDNDDNFQSAERGIVRGTLFPNGAEIWTEVEDATEGVAVGFDPNDPSKAVASVCYDGIYPVSNLRNRCKALYSEDYGVTWSASSLVRGPNSDSCAPPANGEFETCQSEDTIHFAFRTSGSETTIYAQYGNAQPTILSKSVNGGSSFSTDNMQGNPGGINRGVPAFWVSGDLNPPLPGPESIVVITGGQDLYRSKNDARSFEAQPIGGTVVPFHDPVYPHVDMQTVVTDPLTDTNKSVYVGTDGGVFYAEDITNVTGAGPGSTPSGWTVLNNQLQNTQYFTVSGDANPGPGIIIGGTQDNGTLRLVGNSTDTLDIVGGDGGATAVDGTDCYGQPTSREIYRVANCGNAGSSTQPYEVAGYANLPDYFTGVPILPMPFILDPAPNDPGRAFLGVKSVWITRNVKTGTPGTPLYPTWTAIRENPGYTPTPTLTATASPSPTATATASPTATPTSTATGTPTPITYRPQITAMALAPSDSNYMWVAEFYPDRVELGWRQLYRTEHALATSLPNWTTIVGQTTQQTHPLPNRRITKILIDQSSSPHPDETVFVAFGGFQNNNLWRTTDQGATWTDISGGDPASTCLPNDQLVGLPCAPIRAIARHPWNRYALYVGTEIGIYVTTNLNEPNSQNIRWEPVLPGPSNVMISDLEFVKGRPIISPILLAATWGRGLWSKKFQISQQGVETKTLNDFDGDGRSDLAVVREDSAHKDWHIQGSSEAYRSQEFGNRDDQVAAADYDGDGKTDVAVYRGSEQKFFCLRSSDNTLAVTQINAQNAATAQTAVADFDGDDLADEAVFDAYTGHWTVEQSSEGLLEFNWGVPNDTAVAADFNDDGQADFGVYHEASGMITLSYNANGEAFQKQFGLEGDVPVAGEYDGDKVIDLAVWRADDDGEGNGCWYITYGANGYEGFDAIPWGVSGDVPVPGDYDGDGKLDIAVFRPSTGMWHMLQSSNGYYSERFGADGDKPVGVKAVYASRGAGNGTFTKAPSWAEPKRRVEKPRVSNKETQMAD